MIPNKKKTDNIWPTSRTATDLQKLAQKENFALFILKGMKGNLKHLRDIKDPVFQERIRNLYNLMLDCTTKIKVIQTERKRMRRDTKEFK